MPRSNAPANALAVLKGDHQKVKTLFDRFEKGKDADARKRTAQEAINELKLHAAVEEEVFYPSVRVEIDDTSLINEAVEEHHVAKVLIAELEELSEREDQDRFDAKFMVLAENVRHHIKEEEGKMFPQVKKAEMDLQSLGERILQRKDELKNDGVPQSAEEAMVHSGHAVD